jgi:hypothetical protein
VYGDARNDAKKGTQIGVSPDGRRLYHPSSNGDVLVFDTHGARQEGVGLQEARRGRRQQLASTEGGGSWGRDNNGDGGDSGGGGGGGGETLNPTP